MAKLEATFSGEMVASFKYFKEEAFHYKIVDQPFIQGKGFMQKKPFDQFFLANGKMVAMELKAVKGDKPFPLSRIEDHQVSALLKVVEMGGVGLVVVNWRGLPGKEKTVAQVFDIRVIESIVYAGAKSIRHDSVLGEDLPRLKLSKSYGWDVRNLINIWTKE